MHDLLDFFSQTSTSKIANKGQKEDGKRTILTIFLLVFKHTILLIEPEDSVTEIATTSPAFNVLLDKIKM